MRVQYFFFFTFLSRALLGWNTFSSSSSSSFIVLLRCIVGFLQFMYYDHFREALDIRSQLPDKTENMTEEEGEEKNRIKWADGSIVHGKHHQSKNKLPC